jgi:hypothetical protein
VLVSPRRAFKNNPVGRMSSDGKESEEKEARPPPSRGDDGLAIGFSAACRLTTMDACPVRHLVLRFTTLSDGHEQVMLGGAAASWGMETNFTEHV